MYRHFFKRSSETKDDRRGKTVDLRRDSYHNQEKVKAQRVNFDSFFLSFDHKLAKRRERLREELDEIKRKANLYNRPVSTDNDL